MYTHIVWGREGEGDKEKPLRSSFCHHNVVVLLIWKDPILVYKQISEDVVWHVTLPCYVDVLPEYWAADLKYTESVQETVGKSRNWLLLKTQLNYSEKIN